MVLSSRDYLEKALQALRIADDAPRVDDERELRHIAEQYLALAQDALAEEERADARGLSPIAGRSPVRSAAAVARAHSCSLRGRSTEGDLPS
jgi:hypothetical protein